MTTPRVNLQRARRVAMTLGALVVALILLDHAGAFGFSGNDWATLDRQSIRATNVIDTATFTAIVESTGQTITVSLLDVAPPEKDKHWFAEGRRYLQARLKDRIVILKLDGTATRDRAGRVLAYVYVTPGDCLNADLVRDGQAFADRRERHAFSVPIAQSENEVRRRGGGLWSGLAWSDMPAWRQAWLSSFRKH